MSKDKFQDKYDEIFQEMKEEKMNWNFEDFLKKAESEKETPIIPISGNKKPTVPKIFWMAASITLLFGIFFGISKWNSDSGIEDQNTLVQNNIRNQKNDILKNNNVAYHDPSDSLKSKNSSIMMDSLTNEVSNPEKVMNQIVPKRGRLQKVTKERLAYQQNNKNSTPEYEDNFVIVNGHKIKNEEEAINVAKYSFQILSDNVAKTIASSVVQENPNEN